MSPRRGSRTPLPEAAPAQESRAARTAGSREGSDEHRWLDALAVFLVAIGVRVWYLHDLHGSPLWSTLLGDGAGYFAWAQEIVRGTGPGGIFYQSPLYPYLLAAVARVFGDDLLWPRLLQVLLTGVAAVLVLRLGTRVFSRRASLVAAALLALYPISIFFDAEIQKASLSLFLLTSLLWLLMGRDETAPSALFAGVVAGALGLHRENALALLPILALWIACGRTARHSRGARLAALFLLGAATVLLPVAVRNQRVGNELVLTTSQLGPNFYIGNNPRADGTYEPLRPGRGSQRFERADATQIAERALGRTLTPTEVSRHWVRQSLEFIRRQPGAWLRLTARKVLQFWHRHELVDTTSWQAAADFSPLLRGLGALLHFGTLVPLAVLGAVATRGQWRQLLPLYLILATWSLSTALFFNFARYRFPLVAIAALLAGAGIVSLASAIARRGWRELGLMLIAGVLAAAAVNISLPSSDPRAVTYASLGSALADRGDVDAGERMLRRAVDLSPTFAEAHLALGHLALERGDRPEAERRYRRVLQLDPRSAPALNNLGLLAAAAGDRRRAEEHFLAAVAAAPEHAEALFNAAKLLYTRREFAQAQPLLERSLAAVPEDFEANRLLANILAYLGDAEAAVTRYEAALRAEPNSAEVHFKLGVLLLRRGDPRRARAHLEMASRSPAYSERVRSMGRVGTASGSDLREVE